MPLSRCSKCGFTMRNLWPLTQMQRCPDCGRDMERVDRGSLRESELPISRVGAGVRMRESKISR
jgi:uncharacterized protein with PIN domain